MTFLQAVRAYERLSAEVRERMYFAWLKAELHRQEKQASKKGHQRTASLRLADQLDMERAGL